MLNICYFNCFQEPHNRIGEPLAKLVFLRPKERKWEDWRQHKVVLHGMKSIFFPRRNCVVIFVYSLKSRNLEITMYPNTNFNPCSPSGKFLQTSCNTMDRKQFQIRLEWKDCSSTKRNDSVSVLNEKIVPLENHIIRMNKLETKIAVLH